MRKIRHSLTILFIMLAASGALQAQKTLTLDEAIMEALENNYSLKMTRNDQKI